MLDNQAPNHRGSGKLESKVALATPALPHIRSDTTIINSGSVTGLLGSRHLLDHSATKGAIHAFTKSLALNTAG